MTGLELSGVLGVFVEPLHRIQNEAEDRDSKHDLEEHEQILETQRCPDSPFDGTGHIHVHDEMVPLPLEVSDVPGQFRFAQPC